MKSSPSHSRIRVFSSGGLGEEGSARASESAFVNSGRRHSSSSPSSSDASSLSKDEKPKSSKIESQTHASLADGKHIGPSSAFVLKVEIIPAIGSFKKLNNLK